MTKSLVLSLHYGHSEGYDEQNILCGPSLAGVEKVIDCNLRTRIFFDSKESLERAKHQTGWEQYDDKTLIISRSGDYIVTKEPSYCKGIEKTTVYYTDWLVSN